MTKRTVKLQTYAIIARAVEEGVAYGLQRYYKYSPCATTDAKMNQEVADTIEREVMNALCGVIDFQ